MSREKCVVQYIPGLKLEPSVKGGIDGSVLIGRPKQFTLRDSMKVSLGWKTKGPHGSKTGLDLPRLHQM